MHEPSLRSGIGLFWCKVSHKSLYASCVWGNSITINCPARDERGEKRRPNQVWLIYDIKWTYEREHYSKGWYKRICDGYTTFYEMLEADKEGANND